MPKKDFVDMSESGNWNVAADFTKYKVMKPLYDADTYEEIATFGTTDLIEEMTVFDNNPNMKNIARIKGIKRLLRCLSLLVSNTKFAVKKNDKKLMQGFKEDLEEVKKALPFVEERTTDQRKNKTMININEEVFDKLLDILIEIKSKINEPLNRADLIFTSKEDFDPKKLRDKIKDDFINIG